MGEENGKWIYYPQCSELRDLFYQAEQRGITLVQIAKMVNLPASRISFIRNEVRHYSGEQVRISQSNAFIYESLNKLIAAFDQQAAIIEQQVNLAQTIQEN